MSYETQADGDSNDEDENPEWFEAVYEGNSREADDRYYSGALSGLRRSYKRTLGFGDPTPDEGATLIRWCFDRPSWYDLYEGGYPEKDPRYNYQGGTFLGLNFGWNGVSRDEYTFGDVRARTATDLLEWFDSDENLVTFEYDASYRSYHSPDPRTTQVYVDPRYVRSNKKAYGSQSECAEAWADRQFPTHNMDVDMDRGSGAGATIYSSENFRGEQYSDGTGKLVHYSTIADIRTVHDRIIRNSQDFGAGGVFYGAHESHPDRDRIDFAAPLDAIENVLDAEDAEESIYDIVHIHRDNSIPKLNYDSSGVRSGGRSRGGDQLIMFASGRGMVLSVDPTHHSDKEATGFMVSEDEMKAADRVGDLVDLLLPEAVRDSALPVVGSNEITRTDDDRVGNVTQRQGEWFFVPTDVESTGDVRKPLADGSGGSTDNPLGNHVPRDLAQILPRECNSCGESNFEWGLDGSIECKGCGVTSGGDVVRGTVRHDENEHYMARLGETWHTPVSHDRSVVVVRIDEMRDEKTPGVRRERGSRRFD